MALVEVGAQADEMGYAVPAGMYDAPIEVDGGDTSTRAWDQLRVMLQDTGAISGALGAAH